MNIRRANKSDISGILRLLSQVLEIHAKIRPDIFIPGTTKYTEKELNGIIDNDNTPVYVALDKDNSVVGYAFCVLQDVAFSTTMYKRKSLYIDDLCVDESARSTGIGKALFEYVRKKARVLGCSDLTLAVWEGNDSARAFYQKLGMKPKETIMEIKVE